MASVDEITKRLQRNSDVIGLIILTYEGILIKSTLEKIQTDVYVANINQLMCLAREGIREIDANNDLKVLRLRTKTNEIVMVPEKDYTLVVVRDITNKDEKNEVNK